MSLHGNTSLAVVANNPTVMSLDFDRSIAFFGSGAFISELKDKSQNYSDIFRGPGLIPINTDQFDIKGNFNASPESSGELGVLVPTFVEYLPKFLGYVRTAAFSIAEACSQISSKLDKPLSKDALKIFIAEEISTFLVSEIERVENDLDNETIILMPTIKKDIKIHLERLNTTLTYIDDSAKSLHIPMQIDSVQNKVVYIHNAK